MKTIENTVNQANNQLMVIKNTSLLLSNCVKVANKTAIIASKAVLACAILTLVNMFI